MASVSSAQVDSLLQLIQRRFRSSGDSFVSSQISNAVTNAAASTIGRSLYDEWNKCSERRGGAVNETNRHADMMILLQRLSDELIHPAIPLAFLDAIQHDLATSKSEAVVSVDDDAEDFLLQFLSHWVLHLEVEVVQLHASSRTTLLVAALRVLARALVRCATETHHGTSALRASRTKTPLEHRSTATTAVASATTDVLFRSIPTLYQRLVESTSRCVLARETMQAAFVAASTASVATERVDLVFVTRHILSPILASTLLIGRNPNERVHVDESSLWTFVKDQVMQYWSSYTRREQYFWLRWTLCFMNLFISTKMGACDSSTRAVTATSSSWLLEQILLDWCEWARDLVAVVETQGQPTIELNQLVSLVLHEHLPRAFHLGMLSSGATRVVNAVADLHRQQYQSSILTSARSSIAPVSSLATLRWLVHALEVPLTEDRVVVLNLLVQAGICDRADEKSFISQCLLETALPILDHVDPYSRNAVMQQWFEVYLASKRQHSLQSNKRHVALMTLFGLETTDNATDTLYQMVASIATFEGSNLSARHQTAAMLFGVCHLLFDEVSLSLSKESFAFLKSLLATYPDLSIPLLSVVISRIEHVTKLPDRGDGGGAFLLYLEFMCESLAVNSHSAQEIWNLVGVQWMDPHSPLTLRIALVRVYPRLLSSNKRLYRRVVDTIGVCLGSKEMDLRLAAAVTLSDLAADDLIRDVTDVIGWIQNLLTSDCSISPRHTLLVHFAIVTLHSLVVAEELDFDVVVKVLNKKLCSITNFTAMLKLPLLVLESLVLLLGDGESSGNDDDDDKSNEDTKRYTLSTVSPQISAAVKALIHIGQSAEKLRSVNSGDKETLCRIRINVFVSLSKYSMASLGVDEEGVTLAVAKLRTQEEELGTKADVLVENSYETLRNLVVAEFGVPPPNVALNEKSGLIALAAKLVEFEEEVLGSTLWQKRGRYPQQSSRNFSRNADQSVNETTSIRSILPQTSQLQGSNETGPSSATSIALLLSSDGSKLSLLRDLADSSLDGAGDPFHLVFCVHGYMHAISRLIAVKPQSVRSMMSEVISWYEIFVSPDAMHLALSCFLFFVSTSSDSDVDGAILDEIRTTVMTAFSNDEFENGDVGKICIGILAVASLQCEQLDYTKDIVNQLEQSVSGYGGQQSFGAYYGLALVSLACPKYIIRDGVDGIPPKDVVKLACRINGFILEAVVACFENGGEAVSELVESTKRGKIAPTLIDSVLNLVPTSAQVIPEKKTAAQFLFLACAVSFPTLARVNSFLLLAVFRFLESLKWGSGKGVALPAVVRACQKSGVMNDELLRQINMDYVSAFKQRLNGDSSIGNSSDIEDIYFALRAVRWSVHSESEFELPIANKMTFDGSDGSLALVASVLSIASLSSFGTARQELLSHLDENMADEDINEVVELLLETISSGGDGKRVAMGTILMGLLYAISDPEIFDDEFSRRTTASAGIIRRQSDTAQRILVEESSIQLDFRKMPTPQGGTVLEGIGCTIEKFYKTAVSNNQHELVLSQALLSLLNLSIPDKYANGLLEPLVVNGVARNSAVDLVCSQISIRRRAYSDGHSFSLLAAQMCLAPNIEWRKWFGSESDDTQFRFVNKLADMGSKLQVESVNDCLVTIWQNCLASIDTSGRSLLCCFLSSLSRLLSSTAVSPKSMQIIRNVVCKSIYADLEKLPLHSILKLDSSGLTILQTYCRCIKEIPHAHVDELNFFLLSTENVKADVFRALLVLELVNQGYFDYNRRHDSEIANVAAWFSRRILASSDQRSKATFRQMACSFSCALLHESFVAKSTRVTDVLDILILTDSSNCRFVLEWLAVVTAAISGSHDQQRDQSLSFLLTGAPNALQSLPESGQDQLFHMLLHELPDNLAVLSVRHNLSNPIPNYLFRIYKLWLGVGMDTVWLEYVQSSILACYSGPSSPTSNDTMVSIVSSILEAIT